MKTLHVETGRHLYGGAQQVLYLTRGLAERGIDSTLVCPPDAAIAGAAREQGTEVVTIACRGDLDLRFIWRLRELLVGRRPDLVHCHSRRGADFLGGQAAAMAGIAAIVSRRVDNPESGLTASLRYRRFERIVAISAAIRSMLIDTGVDPRRIELIRSAVDVDRFARGWSREAFCSAFGVAPEARLVACAAQLIRRKGQRYLLEAAASLADAYPGLQVFLFGAGPDEQKLRARARDLGLGNVLRFEGFRDDLDDFLGVFDVIAHPALAEGLGVIALKAAAAGVPVVAFDAGGLPEVVRHDRTGLLVPPGDSAALADALAAILDDSDRRERYARSARELARCEFTIEAMVDAHARLYEAVIETRR